jgi:dTDP-4-amino-4,6-dideoxygalactose transaminase
VNNTRIFLSPPDVGNLEKEFVMSALDSGWVAPAGPELKAFEAEVALMCNRSFAVGVSSGTAALHLALLALDVKPGDVVLCATMTFVATANAISYIGAVPVFVDSDLETGNISPALLEQAITSVKASGRRIGAVIPVDFLGKAADYSAVEPICNKHQIPVLADAAESLGAFHKTQPAGSFGSAAIFSFNGNKIATTSGGGIVLTNDKNLADRVSFLSNQSRERTVHYEHREVGYNYRLSNILAAMGRAQLQRLPKMISQRRKNRSRYKELFSSVEGVEVFGGNDEEDNCWLSSITISPELEWSAADLSAFLEASNIETRPLWNPMHLQPLYQSCEAFLDGSSETLFKQGLALPSGSNMSEDQWGRIDEVTTRFLAARS